MAIDPLSSNIINLLSTPPVSTKQSEQENALAGGFGDIFKEAFNTASETDTADKVSALELISGQSDDMSGMLLDAQKAEISLNLAIQIRNKVLDAYNDLIRMQV
ncbi:MAG: flagellar hook-basal body complex protein FliE [Oscillospiraceae bacterium]|jgi:flagellar hook-basal body complex protein FliE|nr:flagellar hook-basal body complex protein FliE [Oscillospiraceae bacterium]